ncbi:hypothetical protein [Stenotrophomonas sp.]|uniref:hypothetical protein n=1 Tax=Stenotrophomonas sp. TaxID=69392 RepID=UPI0028A7F2A2|nr:hypothetical protein [Stenotrophomonas sp.]
MRKFLFALFVIFSISKSNAQGVHSPSLAAADRIRHSSIVAPVEGSFVGEMVSDGSGALEIVQTDIDIPGNNAIPVRVSRRFIPGNYGKTNIFVNWELDLPHAYGVFSRLAPPTGWAVGWPAPNRYKRCSLFSTPAGISFQGGQWDADEYWNGNFIHVPGSGDRELLARGKYSHVPSDGFSYPIVTKEGDAVRCVALSTTSEAGSRGEGFEVVSSDGLIYTLNHMVSKIHSTLKKSNPLPKNLLGRASLNSANFEISPLVSNNYVLARVQVKIFPTKVSDQFGNFVEYNWSSKNPSQLLSIVASDGRAIYFNYDDAKADYVSTITDGSRVWSYVSDHGDAGFPVTYPDGSRYSFSLEALHRASARPIFAGCDEHRFTPGSFVGTVTGPSGVSVEFTLSKIEFGRSWVPRGCNIDVDGNESIKEHFIHTSLALVKKVVKGPGLAKGGLIWNYEYGPANNCWSPGGFGVDGNACTAASPTTRTVSVVDPRGGITRRTFSNRFRGNEGLLLREEYGVSGAAVLRTVEYTYGSVEAAPYRAYNGISIRNVGDYDTTSFFRPISEVRTSENGRAYVWRVASDCDGNSYCFDTRGRPVKVVKESFR